MSSCIEKLAHECGTSDALQVFEDDGTFTGYCFACDTYVPDPYGDKPPEFRPQKIKKSPEETSNGSYRSKNIEYLFFQNNVG